MKLDERIKTCRRSSGLTQEQVAEAIGVSRQAVTKWENGRSAPSTENLFRLAELFGTSVDLLLNENDVSCSEDEEKDMFAFLYSKDFWISTLTGLFVFFVSAPYGRSMYIPVLFNLIGFVLCACTGLLLALILRRKLSGTDIGEDFGMYLGLLISCLIGHSIFAVMFWGSWICIVCSVLAIVWLMLKKRSENRKKIENST